MCVFAIIPILHYYPNLIAPKRRKNETSQIKKITDIAIVSDGIETCWVAVARGHCNTAIELAKDYLGVELEDDEYLSAKRLPDKKRLTIRLDDYYTDLDGNVCQKIETKTAREWAAEYKEPSVIGSTLY